jgi:hypothetical protein
MNRSELQENLDNLKEIQRQMEELCGQSNDIVRMLKRDDETHMIGARAESYWLPHIWMEVTEENRWVGKQMCGMYDTINEMQEALDEMPNEDDESSDDE